MKPSEEKGTRKANIFKMNVFAPNKVVAKSRFWYYMSMLNRVKKANGEVLQISEVCWKHHSISCTLHIHNNEISKLLSTRCKLVLYWVKLLLFERCVMQHLKIFAFFCRFLQIVEKRPNTVSNYGIWMRYDSRTGHHNMYREYRDVSVNGAVSKMFQDVASRHRSRFSNVQIVRTASIRNDMLRKSTNKDYLGNVKFPLTHRVVRPSSKAFKKTFVARRPRTNFDY